MLIKLGRELDQLDLPGDLIDDLIERLSALLESTLGLGVAAM